MDFQNSDILKERQNKINNENIFNLIESYFKEQHLFRLVRHQIESYNDFIEYQIQKTIKMFNPVIIHSDKDYVEDKGKYILEIYIEFDNFKLYPPQIHENNGATKTMLPQEARLRNFTYASNMTVDINIKYIVRNTECMEIPITYQKTLTKINIGKMPLMVKSSVCVLTLNKIDPNLSGECPMDPGGYFIIKGSEKTVLGQERMAENKIFCFDGKGTTKWSWVAEIKSVPDYKCISPKQIEMVIANKNNGYGNGIYVIIPLIKQPVELFVLFRALGIISDKDICTKILLDINDKNNNIILNFLQASIVDSNKYMTQEQALKHITSFSSFVPINMDKETGLLKKREFTLKVLNNDLFPHCRTIEQKIYLIGYMANKLIKTSLGYIPTDDRDSYVNKHIDLTGVLLNNLFRNCFNKMVKEMQKQVIDIIKNGAWRSSEDYLNIINITNIYKIIKSSTIENGITKSLATGDFNVNKSNNSKAGVAQVLNRLTYISSISHLRRINTPVDKGGELVSPRKLHNTSWGFICPVETPEGQSIGIVKNISYMCHITISSNSNSLYTSVEPYIIYFNDIQTKDIYNKVKVIINGTWIGITLKPLELYNDIKNKKYNSSISIYTSIVFDFKLLEIRICNDGGRLTRPLLKVRNNKILLTNKILSDLKQNKIEWNDLLISHKLGESVIEYIDPDEQNYSMIAMTQNDLNNNSIKYTHCELHPSTIFGILASCIPFPEHNQSPRNTYQTAMQKQSIGIYATNYDYRMDKTSYMLINPTRPLVDTRIMNILKLNKISSGCQVHVAIMTHTGYNQEDSILINKGSIDRGLFMADIRFTERDEDKNIIRDEIIRCNPSLKISNGVKTRGMKIGNYNKLNENGFIDKDVLVENRDIIISKIIPIKENRNDSTKLIKYEDQSKLFRTTEKCYIDKNYTGRNGDGYNFAKVRIRTTRKPVIGDKFSSRAGQKGTIGNIIPENDMPFTKNGLKPDIIINPHAIPSRMTIAQLKETLLGKVLLELGLFGDGTSFGDLNINTICNELQKLGYESNGNEIMYDGTTGQQMSSTIFIGPVFYQRLKHMVNDKQHSRSIGPMVNLTRQPAEGRARDGGFRIGEMERDVMIAHGMSYFCKERLYDASDKYSVHICNKCGMISPFNNNINPNINMSIHCCLTCQNKTDFSKVNIPYTFKLLMQELQTINISTRLITY